MSAIESKPLKRVVIKEELVALTGDAISALCLNQLLYWTKILNEGDEEIKKEVEALRKVGSDFKADKLQAKIRNGWFFKSAAELQEEIMIGTRPTVQRKLQALVEKPYIMVGKNPDPSQTWDRTNWYKIDVLYLQYELEKLGYALEGYPLLTDEQRKTLIQRIAQNEQCNDQNEQCNAHSEQSIDQNEQCNAHSEQTIPEITSENPSKITPEITSRESIYQKEIDEIDLPVSIKKVLTKKIDRLILYQIDLHEVSLKFKSNELTADEFANVLNDVLSSEIKKSFSNKLQTSIDNYITNRNKKQQELPKPVVDVPEYLKANNEVSAAQEDVEEENRIWLENLLKGKGEVSGN